MNAHADMTFKSSRIADAAEEHVTVATNSHGAERLTSVLMISTSAVVLERFEQAAPAAEMTVTTRNGTLASLLAAKGVAAFDHDIVMFEMHSDDPDQMPALREVAAACAGRTRFMALTAENLSLAQA
ncbi:MAG: hypothetical protein ACRC6I_16075, partial [Paracoccaceae bacterium]